MLAKNVKLVLLLNIMQRIILFLFLGCWLTSVCAQTDTLKLQPVKVCQPKKMWVPVAASAVTLGIGFLVEKPVNSFMIHHQNNLCDGLSNFTDALGNPKFMAPALLATFGGSYLLKDNKLKTTTWNSLKAVMMSSVTTEALKISIGRARPFMKEGNMTFDHFNGHDEYKSMPSGHSSFAFAVFTPFAETYSRWIYVIPAAVALGRVYQEKHWLTDVMVGSSIGWISGYLFTHSKKKIVVTPGGLVIWF